MSHKVKIIFDKTSFYNRKIKILGYYVDKMAYRQIRVIWKIKYLILSKNKKTDSTNNRSVKLVQNIYQKHERKDLQYDRTAKDRYNLMKTKASKNY